MRKEITLAAATALSKMFTPVEARKEAVQEASAGSYELDLTVDMPTHLVDTQLVAFALLDEALFDMDVKSVAFCGSMVKTTTPTKRQLKWLKDLIAVHLPEADIKV